MRALLRPGRRVEITDGAVRRWPLFLQPLRDRLGLRQGAQYVLAGELAQIGVAPATADQLREECRIRGLVLETDRKVVVSAVEVGTDANMVNAGNLPDVINAVGDVIERRQRARQDPRW